MKITLDGQPLNYTLEGEQNLFQVLSGIAQWLRPQKVEISQVRVNGSVLSLGDRSAFENLPLNEIEELDIQTETETEHEFKELQIIYQYFQLLKAAIEARKADSLGNILEEYPHIQVAVERYFKNIFHEEGNARFPMSGAPIGEEEWKQAERFTQTILSLVEGRIHEITHPLEECGALVPLMERTKEDIEQTSVLLQTGRDREAIQRVLTLIEILSKSLRILGRIMPEDPRIQELHRTLSAPLRDLNEAFLHKDSVLIGDLLEYEIAPQLDGLRRILSAVTAVK